MTRQTAPTPALTVPFIDLAVHDPALKAKLLEAADRVLSHGQFILGPEVKKFEEDFAAYTGTTYAVGIGNGTDSLTLTMKGLGIGPGDEVITAANSFLASASSVIFAGARPVLVDMLDDCTIDPVRVEAAVTPHTKAIIPVHLMGQPADMDAILAIAEKHGLYVIEDAAQAAGAKIGDRRVGSLGTAGSFSFHPLKTLNACGDAGMVTTNDRKLYEYLLLARTHGLKDRDDCVFWSPNSRLDALQAAFLGVKLPYLDQWNAARRAHAAFYQTCLADVVEVARETPGTFNVFYMFVIQTDRRDDLQRFLRERGIESAVHYPTPIHLKRAAKDLGYKRGDFPVTERWSDRILSIPATQWHSKDQCAYVADTVREFFSKES
ncbi:MAG: pyridoxal-phosphate-dependent aminotransferase [Candidatus Peregrinibacteria bacterium Gr01-1014_25]|nr:MAG: pyridoxal-phosphate-dependent aminotransferase [Candidatus Peregrinibacteria bacterium Gr01-1014_25]